jgi:pSer/pThr/pTyr-binding forkhead associated (FHA) protein
MPDKLLKIRVTLKGRPVKALALSNQSATIGRDPGADLFLDNPGISREHARIELTPSGSYRIVDLGSANGIFVNEHPVKMHFISNNDVVFVGKFALWFTYEEDHRGERDSQRRLAGAPDEGTTVLKASELQEMIDTARATESAPPPAVLSAAAVAAAPVATLERPDLRRMRSLIVLGILLAFAAGYVAGGGLRWIR